MAETAEAWASAVRHRKMPANGVVRSLLKFPSHWRAALLRSPPQRIGNDVCSAAASNRGRHSGIMRKRLRSKDRGETLDVEEDVHLYLPHLGSELDYGTAPWWLNKPGGELYTLDVRG